MTEPTRIPLRLRLRLPIADFDCGADVSTVVAPAASDVVGPVSKPGFIDWPFTHHEQPLVAPQLGQA